MCINPLYRVWLMFGIAPAIAPAPAAHQILHIISQVGSSHLAVIASDNAPKKTVPVDQGHQGHTTTMGEWLWFPES